MRRVQVFDVNETLLDLAAMDPHFERIFGDAGLRQVWFTQMIQSALVATVTGVYSDFGAHAMAALEMTAENAGVELREEDHQPFRACRKQPPGGAAPATGAMALPPSGSARPGAGLAEPLAASG